MRDKKISLVFYSMSSKDNGCTTTALIPDSRGVEARDTQQAEPAMEQDIDLDYDARSHEAHKLKPCAISHTLFHCAINSKLISLSLTLL
jgi:hypothetical protein